MRLRDAAVAGLASSTYGRRLQPRQLDSYDDGNSTETTVTAVQYTTATSTTSPPLPPPPPAYESEPSDTPIIVAPVPYSSSQPAAPVYETTTKAATQYTTGTSVASVESPVRYTSQEYTYAPPPPTHEYGTAPSAYTSPNPTSPSTYVPTGASPAPTVTSYTTADASNETCSGATLNVLDASLDWWYTKTLYNAVSTFNVLFNSNDSATGWTVLPASTPFNVQSAIAVPDCTSSPIPIPSSNRTRYDVTCTPAPSPIAAETTIITQTAYKDPPASSGNGSLPPLIITPKPASISVPDAAQTPWSQGTPFVYFSEYEIVSKNPTTYSNGSTGCAQATQTFTMDDPFSFEYTGADVNGTMLVNEGVVGDVNPALLGLVGQDTAVAGSWVAAPTVVLLVQEVLAAQAALAATVEPTATSLDVPTPTRPTYVTLTPTGPTQPPVFASPVIEQTAESLQLPTPGAGDGEKPTNVGPAEQTQGSSGGSGGGRPVDAQNQGGDSDELEGGHFAAFVAELARTDITLQLPAAATQNVITTVFQGQTITATRLSAIVGEQGGFDNLIDAVNSVAHLSPSPTNALDVLSAAAATFPGHNPTANAILNGIGGTSGGDQAHAEEDNVPSRVITVGGAIITANAQNQFDLGSGQTLTPGGVAVVDGTTLSLDSAASAVIVNGVTQPVGSPAQATGEAGSGPNIPLITMDNAAVTPNAATEYSFAPGATLTPGGSLVVDGTTMSLDRAATAIVVNGVTRNLASPAGTITGNAAGVAYTIAPGATLTPGGSVVLAGTTLSLDAAATGLVVNGVTRTLDAPGAPITAGALVIPGSGGGSAAVSGGASTMPPILTIGGETYHAINNGVGTSYIIDGETLTMGEEETVTVDGTGYRVSLAPEATRLVVGTEGAGGVVTGRSTQTLFPEQGVGGGDGGPRATGGADGGGSGGVEEQVGNAAAAVAVGSVWSWGGVCAGVGAGVLGVWL